MTRTLLLLAPLLSLASIGCNVATASIGPLPSTRHPDAGAETTPTSTDGEVDEGAALAPIENGGFESSRAFDHLTPVPYASTAASGMWIDQWVSAEGAAEYTKISPDATGSHAAVPPGTMIVRSVLDAKGVATKLTLMMKGPPGYNPALGDWWFGETDPYGAPMKEDAGDLTGRLAECYGCHLPRKDDDFLFGVSPTNRGVHP